MPYLGNSGQFSNIYEKNHTTSTLRIIEGSAGYDPVGEDYTLNATLQEVTDIGATTTNTVKFNNTGTSLTTLSRVGIANAAPSYKLSIGGAVHMDDAASNVLVTAGNAYIQSNFIVGNSNLSVDTVNGYVGINKVSPEYELDVVGDIHITGTIYQNGIEYGGADSSYWIKDPDTLYYNTANVGIGTTDASSELHVVGNVQATYFSGDGSALTNIQSSNVSDFASNVIRIDNVIADLSSNASRIDNLITDLSSNATRIDNVITDLSSNATRIDNVITDLSSNATRIDNVITDLSSNATRIDNVIADLSSNATRIDNVIADLSSNATRIDNVITDLSSNATRIDNVITDLSSNASRIDNLTTDLSSNATRIDNLESSDLTIGGVKTFSSNLQVGTSNLFVDTTTSKIGIGTDTPLSTLDVRGDYAMGGHIIPSANDVYDIGSPEFKIRDLFVSNNSMWIGDRTKIAFENGKMKFKRRKVDKVPKVVRELAIANVENVTNEADVRTDALTYAQQRFPNDGITALADLQLQHWKAYTKSIDDTKEISDIFVDDDEDYEVQSAADAWNEIGSNIYSTHKMTIGSNVEPRATLDVKSTDALIVPTGTTDERPASSVVGMLRYNSTTDYFETYTTGGWTSIATPPSIVSFSPNPATYADVTTEVITVTGTFFDAQTSVQLEGANGTLYDITNFTFVDTETIRFTIGTLVSGQLENRPYRIVVTNGSGLTTKSTTTLGFGNPTWSSPASGSTQTFYTSQSTTLTLSATDFLGGSSVSYSVVGSLPGGLALSGSSISGTSTESGGTQSTVTIRATDTGDTSAYTDLTFTIETIDRLYEFSSHTFTNAGQTGRTGPTLTQLRSAYTPSWTDNVNYFTVTPYTGIQQWTVPQTGTYQIDAYGATGGYAYLSGTSTIEYGGRGARIRGRFNLNKGDYIRILVGQMGVNNPNSSRGGGGGGGTFVYNSTTSRLLIAAGGGGGSGQYARPTSADPNVNSINGTGGNRTNPGAGGTDGNGGEDGSYSGAGAGWLGNGLDSPGFAAGGTRFLSGGYGGTGYSDGTNNGVNGGFGGGGGSYSGGGGGGGYSGGGGGGTSASGFGGGGGSYFDSSVTFQFTELNQTDNVDGKVIITFV